MDQETTNYLGRNHLDEWIGFLREASRYFANRGTNGEDRAYWANIYNSEKCTLIADYLEERKIDDAGR